MGPVNDRDFPAGIVLWHMKREGKLRDLNTGVAAIVWLYYTNYTDATQIEPVTLRALVDVFGELMVDDDAIYEMIKEAEKTINDSGGIMSDTDGGAHEVRTPSAWEERE